MSDLYDVAFISPKQFDEKKLTAVGGFKKFKSACCDKYRENKDNLIERGYYAYIKLDFLNNDGYHYVGYFKPNKYNSYPNLIWRLAELRTENKLPDFVKPSEDQITEDNNESKDSTDVDSNKKSDVANSAIEKHTIVLHKKITEPEVKEEKSADAQMDDIDVDEDDNDLLPDMGVVGTPNAFIGKIANEKKSLNTEEALTENTEDVKQNEKNIEEILDSSLSLQMVDVKGNQNLDSFKLGEYVVVQELYNAIMGNNPSYFNDKDPTNYPVENLTWEDALKFCNELSISENLEPVYKFSEKGQSYIPNANGYRLPTLDEWKYASKGGELSEHHKYAGSEFARNVAWWIDDNPTSTHPVNDPKKKSNELNLYGMCGNVWEWCWDTKTQAPVCCGGGYDSSEDQIAIDSSRFTRTMDYYAKDKNIGFRLAKSK